MPSRTRSLFPLLLALGLLAAGIALYLRFRPAAPEPVSHLADLGSEPDWAELDQYAGVLTRAEFEAALGDFYTLGPYWKEHFLVDDQSVAVVAHDGSPFAIPFARDLPGRTPPRRWRPASALPAAPEGKPLQGLRIAIDPGHIGGDYAKLEERWYRIGDGKPVAEGDLTLRTALLLQPRLEALGAKVRLLRDKARPVSGSQPEDFLPYARKKMPGAPEKEVVKLARRLFYRTAEIRARARIVNQDDSFQPDFVLCLHYNAEAWGDAASPQFSPRNHFHLILHGAYTPSELAHDDERVELLHKLFQGIHLEEASIARELVKSFEAETGLPPYVYRLDAPAIRIGPAMWARNLLANRLYRCPVLFLEPYVMNNEEVYQRVQAGDYEGTREVAGKPRRSIYREYVDAVVGGLVNYYEPRRQP